MADQAGTTATEGERSELVFALCHEIGNLVAAIRLEAHLLDGSTGELGLARSSISIEDLSSRVGALLTQIRPLMKPASADDVGRVAPGALLSNLRDDFGDRGAGGARVEIGSANELPDVVGDPERTNALLWLLAVGAVEAVEANGGTVRVDAREVGDQVEIRVCDDGKPDLELGEWREAAQRGRALVCQVAQALVEPLGGSLDVDVEDGATRLSLRLARAAE